MGISREEPLEIMASTAGDRVTGWGKQQWDYGELVNNGDVEDMGFLHACYAAPQDATDEQLTTDKSIWYAANPSLGKIIDPEQFEKELKAAKSTPSKWANFKKYRFNIWQSTSSPWLPAEDWAACAETQLRKETLTGSNGYLGMDMSLARDMTAINLIIPVGRDDYSGEPTDPEAKTYYQLPLMWITEFAVDKWKHLVPYEDWIKRGMLNVHEGRQLDFAKIRRDIVEFCAEFHVMTLSFDAKYAIETAPMLADELNCELIEFRQSILEYAEPTQMYERLVKLHLMRHFNHPVLNWMAGHVEVTNPDRSGNYRPVKPAVADKQESREAHKSIDGIIAGVMAIREASHADAQRSMYDTPGALSL
jgi:phage terminase large subunit-like protein